MDYEWVTALLAFISAYKMEVIIIAVASTILLVQHIRHKRAVRRGNVLGKKAQRERELHVNSLVGLHWILTVEELWSRGILTKKERDHFCEMVAFRVSDKTLLAKGREKYVKQRIQKELKALKAQKPLPFPAEEPKPATEPTPVNNVRKLQLKAVA